MRSLSQNTTGSVIPIILFVVTIVGVGALYTLFFLEVGIPQFGDWVPASDSKTFIMMGIYAIPLFVLIIGAISLIRAGLKREVY